jgi:hypothetical protein
LRGGNVSVVRRALRALCLLVTLQNMERIGRACSGEPCS